MAKITIKVNYDAEAQSDAEAAQEARDVAAQRMKATVSEDRPKVDVPAHLKDWEHYLSHAGKQVKEQALDLWRHPENIVGAGPLGEVGAPLIGVFGVGGKNPPIAAARTALLKTRLLEGKTYQQIADEAGVHVSTIHAQAQSLGLSSSRPKGFQSGAANPRAGLTYDIEQVREMRSQGMTWKDMAEKLETTEKALRNFGSRQGIKKPTMESGFEKELPSSVSTGWVTLPDGTKQMFRGDAETLFGVKPTDYDPK